MLSDMLDVVLLTEAGTTASTFENLCLQVPERGRGREGGRERERERERRRRRRRRRRKVYSMLTQ